MALVLNGITQDLNAPAFLKNLSCVYSKMIILLFVLLESINVTLLKLTR